MAALRPNGHIIVSLYGLAPTKGDEVYVVWLTSGGDAPIKVGSLSTGDAGSGSLEVDNVPMAANLSIYVCREPNGSVTMPTGPTVLEGTISL
jgi:anti-sigma-K factor RskA